MSSNWKLSHAVGLHMLLGESPDILSLLGFVLGNFREPKNVFFCPFLSMRKCTPDQTKVPHHHCIEDLQHLPSAWDEPETTESRCLARAESTFSALSEGLFSHSLTDSNTPILTKVIGGPNL